MANERVSIPSPGTAILIKTQAATYRGTLMPNTTPELLVLKLESGYNIGVKKESVIDLVIEEHKRPRQNSPQATPRAQGTQESQAAEKDSAHSHLPIISILHTGGTIASKVDYETGGVIARYTPSELLEMFPELAGIARIRSRLVRNMWSEDMRFAHYNIIAREIEAEIKGGSQGVIITHGTDTLHYSAAALSFMLENLRLPVILVGSQRSSDRASSDARMNILAAATFIAKTPDFAEVGICMHENSSDETCVILPGTKCRKMHSSRRDAFQAINVLPFARIRAHIGQAAQVEMIRQDYRTPTAGMPALIVKQMKEDIKVSIIRIHPNMYHDELLAYRGYAGLIVEGAGIAGHVPINEIDLETRENAKIAQAIKALVESGTIVASTTQTIFGGINMNVYTTGRKMQELGMIGNYTDMTTETAFIKLAWLLSNYPKDQAKELYAKNLRGEISARLENIPEETQGMQSSSTGKTPTQDAGNRHGTGGKRP